MYMHGFNILELMITVAIAGIVALIGIPAMTTTVEDARVRSVTNDLTTSFNLARSEAVRAGTEYRVMGRPDPDNSNAPSFQMGWCVVPEGDDCSDDNAVVRIFDAPGNVDFSVSGTRVTFDAQGARDSGVETFEVQPPNCTAGDRARTVSISPSGRPNVTREACS